MTRQRNSSKRFLMFDFYHLSANFLSISRVILMPFYAYFYLNNAYTLCVYITLIALLTDMLDGYVARKSSKKSEYGSWVDPICDAVTMLTITVLFYLDNLIPNLFIIWLVARYAVFTIIAMNLKSTKLQSNIYNKLSIGAFAVYGYSILLGLIHPIWQTLSLPALIVTVSLQAISLYTPLMMLINQNMRVCKK